MGRLAVYLEIDATKVCKNGDMEQTLQKIKATTDVMNFVSVEPHVWEYQGDEPELTVFEDFNSRLADSGVIEKLKKYMIRFEGREFVDVLPKTNEASTIDNETKERLKTKLIKKIKMLMDKQGIEFRFDMPFDCEICFENGGCHITLIFKVNDERDKDDNNEFKFSIDPCCLAVYVAGVSKPLVEFYDSKDDHRIGELYHLIKTENYDKVIKRKNDIISGYDKIDLINEIVKCLKEKTLEFERHTVHRLVDNDYVILKKDFVAEIVLQDKVRTNVEGQYTIRVCDFKGGELSVYDSGGNYLRCHLDARDDTEFLQANDEEEPPLVQFYDSEEEDGIKDLLTLIEQEGLKEGKKKDDAIHRLDQYLNKLDK